MPERCAVRVAVFFSLVVAGCAQTPSVGEATPSRTPEAAVTSSIRSMTEVLRMDFEPPAPLRVRGGASLEAEAVSLNGANLMTVPSWESGLAVRFPAASRDAEPPGLMILIAGPGLPNPGPRAFAYGADVRLDPVSVSDADDGDNILQRGLASDSRQFKLQVDAGRPSCVVEGTSGRVTAKAKQRLEDGWYRLRCERSGDDLVLTVIELEDDGSTAITTTTMPAGDVTFPAGTPLSIGRKSTAAGEPVINKPDQFNGALDNVWISVADA